MSTQETLKERIKTLGIEMGFDDIGVADIDLSHYEPYLLNWLKKGHHGEMAYMKDRGTLRTHPEQLVPGTKSIIVVRKNYLPPSADIKETLKDKTKAYIARYTLGRDYHKVLRKQLKKFAIEIKTLAGEFGFRPTVDSAPIMEKALAEKAGLGWIGKNTLVLNKKAGSYFFIGTLLTDLELPFDAPTTESHCGKCKACMKFCPTNAFVGPNELDARRCISYLTIELKGPIPLELRPLMGNRIFGCDDCQLICPWNRYAKITDEKDFHPRHQLDNQQLVDLFLISEERFLDITTGSAIRRTGYIGWLRNIAVALGNAPHSNEIVSALKQREHFPSELVQEHVAWALLQQARKKST